MHREGPNNSIVSRTNGRMFRAVHAESKNPEILTAMFLHDAKQWHTQPPLLNALIVSYIGHTRMIQYNLNIGVV